MNVASLELCKELYELSGWWRHDLDSLFYTPHIGRGGVAQRGANGASTPAYSLGFLLRKLPNTSITNYGSKGYPSWNAMAYEHSVASNADSPEDAAAKLAIELFKHGVLTKEVA